METEYVNIPLEAGLRHKLAKLAETMECNEAELIGKALANYFDLQDWQREQIEHGIAAADRGEFASDEAMSHILNKYTSQ